MFPWVLTVSFFMFAVSIGGFRSLFSGDGRKGLLGSRSKVSGGSLGRITSDFESRNSFPRGTEKRFEGISGV